MTANGVEVQKALVTGVLDDQAQFVDVSGKHQGRRTLGSQRRMTTSQGVDGKGIRMGLDAFANHLTGIILVTGRRTSFEKLL